MSNSARSSAALSRRNRLVCSPCLASNTWAFFGSGNSAWPPFSVLPWPEHAAFGIEHFQVHAVERLAAFQRLGKHIQAIGIAVHRQADITQGEQGRRLR